MYENFVEGKKKSADKLCVCKKESVFTLTINYYFTGIQNAEN